MPRFDQHFLRARHYAEQIAEAVSPLPGETLLEVGPGQGQLTRYLLAKPFPYIGVEIDGSLLESLKTLPLAEKAQWIQGDFLTIDLPPQPLYFVSNLPYSITGPALFRILEKQRWIRAGVLMLQAEVADKLCAQPGQRTWGRLSLLFQSVYRVRRLFRVPPGAFSPPPRVWSAVVTFERSPQVPLEEWSAFADFVRQACLHPRRTLRANLREAGLSCPTPWAALRPHQLSIQALYELWKLSLARSSS
ncbi:MAG: ribosomal RNA small subunit methyltransferase A [Bacteroidetes bacterium]|nr:MAG: ribosomal RNA small subunit methyltransferase A [Bacteroidota bacterium]